MNNAKMKLAELREFFEEKALEGHGAFAIAWAVLDLADAQEETAKAIQRLGNGDASTQFGAIENLAMQIEKVARALG